MMKKWTRRESAWLIAACLVVISIGYWRLRYVPAQQRIREVLRGGEAVGGATDPAQQLSRLSEDLAQAKQSLAREREDLTALEQQLVPENQPDAVQRLKVELSTLATSSGSQIREHVPYQLPAASAGSTATIEAKLAGGVLYRRPLQRLTMETTYAGLRRFMQGLDRLSWRVTVLRLEVEAVNRAGFVGAPQPLMVTMVLAL